MEWNVERSRHLFDECEDVAHRALEPFFVHGVFADREVADDCIA